MTIRNIKNISWNQLKQNSIYHVGTDGKYKMASNTVKDAARVKNVRAIYFEEIQLPFYYNIH